MRSIHKLKINELYSIIHYTGYVCILLGIVMLIPILIAVLYGEYSKIMPFIYSSTISLILGIILFMRFNIKKELSIKTAMIFVTIIWLIGSAIAALPYYFSGDLSYLNAYFEAM
ncbi:MAG: TrkH family potassium uptake protein, partial [Methanobacterium sp.]